ncbi:MAG: iron-containing alcohol dehydrogenase [Planctomycetia bacterium]|jgi:alcohol dehydrogenase class IV
MNAAADLARYDFAAPPLVRFGAGRIGELGELVALHGREAWLVGGVRSFVNSSARQAIERSLIAAGIPWRLVAESAGEPTVDQVAAAVAGLPVEGRETAVVVAIGGGAAIDLAKAVAALATNAGHLPPGPTSPEAFDALVVDHLEGVGSGRTISRWPLPLVAVPTTAGTGAEATRNAVISCPRRRFKKSMRSPMMVPRAAIVDPELTLSCDRGATAASGTDCITQLIEAFICRFKKPLPRALVLESLPRAVGALPRVLRDPADLEARGALSHAALLSGLALANSGLGMAHGVAAALGVECATPHGVACGLMLPVALAVNAEAARGDFAILERSIDPDAPADDRSAAASFVARITDLCAEAGLPRRLSEVGLERSRLRWLAEHSGGTSMRGNPVELSAAALEAVLERFY